VCSSDLYVSWEKAQKRTKYILVHISRFWETSAGSEWKSGTTNSEAHKKCIKDRRWCVSKESKNFWVHLMVWELRTMGSIAETGPLRSSDSDGLEKVDADQFQFNSWTSRLFGYRMKAQILFLMHFGTLCSCHHFTQCDALIRLGSRFRVKQSLTSLVRYKRHSAVFRIGANVPGAFWGAELGNSNALSCLMWVIQGRSQIVCS
jgi:hypothetical protein